MSIHDIKTELSNMLLMNLILSKYRVDPKFYKIHQIYEILNFGKMQLNLLPKYDLK